GQELGLRVDSLRHGADRGGLFQLAAKGGDLRFELGRLFGYSQFGLQLKVAFAIGHALTRSGVGAPLRERPAAALLEGVDVALDHTGRPVSRKRRESRPRPVEIGAQILVSFNRKGARADRVVAIERRKAERGAEGVGKANDEQQRAASRLAIAAV